MEIEELKDLLFLENVKDEELRETLNRELQNEVIFNIS